MPDDLPIQKTLVRATADDTHQSEIGIVAGRDGQTRTLVVAMSVWRMVAVRVARNYLQVVLGLLLADGLGAVELAKNGTFWVVLLTCAKIALAPATVSLIQNSIEFLTKLDVSNPELRG